MDLRLTDEQLALQAAARKYARERLLPLAQETERTGDLITRLNGEGMTMLVVEHDMTFVRQIAQRITVLHLGRVFAQGSPDAIIADPRVEEIYLGGAHDT